LRATDTVNLSVEIKNTGKFTGKEVVQAYINDQISSVVTPVQVLKGFEKVEIKPDQKVTVHLSIPCRELGLWDKDMNYVVEPGAFDIMVGASAEDIRLRDSVVIVK
jgi:beta-glucosidase